MKDTLILTPKILHYILIGLSLALAVVLMVAGGLAKWQAHCHERELKRKERILKRKKRQLHQKELEVQRQHVELERHRAELEHQRAENEHQRAELQRHQAELEHATHLLHIEPLTSAYNRYAYQDELPRYAKRATLVLIAFDIDHFKGVNDTYGHDAGDEVLKRVAQTAMESLRAGNRFYRPGGEEFAIAVPDGTLEEGLAIAERVRIAIAEARIWCDERMLQVTASFGVAFIVKDGDISLLKKDADRRLYLAKRGGRNRVVASDDESTDEASPPV